MSKSSLVNYTKLTDHCSSRNGTTIDKITIHHMAGNLTVEECGNVFINKEASSNYGIDSKGNVGLYVDESKRAWSTANPSNDRRAINIELANDGGAPEWHVSDITINKCIELCTDICKRYNFKLTYDETQNGSLTSHNMFINTTCPGPYLKSKFSYIAEEVNKRLDQTDTRPSEETLSGVVANFQKWLNNTYNYNLSIDNIFGSDTKKHSIKALQTEFNKQLGSKLIIDGIFGPLTKKACSVLKNGTSGNITRLVQSMLVIKGYDIGTSGIDGIYGNATIKAVKNFQSKNNLSIDGLCGKNTFEKLFK